MIKKWIKQLLRSAFQKKNNQIAKFMIEDFIDSVLIIDDKENEISNLRDLLQSKDIWVKHYLPEQLKKVTNPLKSRKLIFLDLQLEEDKDTKNNVSLIRSLFKSAIGKNFGCYGIVLWSKHTEDINELKERMANDGESYSLPLFIVGVDKTKYIKAGNYDDLLVDIDAALKANISAGFFVYCDKLINLGKNHSIRNIYSLAKDYTTQEKDLQFILYRLALNQTGIPEQEVGNYTLENDAIKAIADMLHYDVIHQHQEEIKLFDKKPIIFSGDTLEVFAKLNSKLFLDFQNINQDHVIPGNVYEILDPSNFFSIPDAPEGSTRILIEITPPCDFAVSKKAKRSRVLGGFCLDTFASDNQKKSFTKDHHYKELSGLYIEGVQKIQTFRFDYRYSGSIDEDQLKNTTKYKLLYKFKDKLFADILQKASSHSSRLGLPFIK